jgi:hypothetical protein
MDEENRIHTHAWIHRHTHRHTHTHTHTYHGLVLSHKEKWNYVIWMKMDGTEDRLVSDISQAQKPNIACS